MQRTNPLQNFFKTDLKKTYNYSNKKKITNHDPFLFARKTEKHIDQFFFVQTQKQKGSKRQNCKKWAPVVFGQATG